MEQLVAIRVYNFDVEEHHRVFIRRHGSPHLILTFAIPKGKYKWTPWYMPHSKAIVPTYLMWKAPPKWAVCANNRADIYWTSDEGGIDIDVKFGWLEPQPFRVLSMGDAALSEAAVDWWEGEDE